MAYALYRKGQGGVIKKIKGDPTFNKMKLKKTRVFRENKTFGHGWVCTTLKKKIKIYE